MKIVFWSPVHGQAGTTSNLLATSLLIGMLYQKNCLITQTHFNYNNLEAPLIGSNSKNTASRDYFRDVGLDALIRSFKAAKLNFEATLNCCISLSDTNVCVLPGTSKNNKESFDYEMNSVFLNLLRTIEDYFEIVFLDVSSGLNPLSKQIMDEADLIVVNLSQNMGFIDQYLDTYKKLAGGKVFYLFGNYDNASKYNIYNIRRRYRKYITQGNSGVIPYNTAFHDAQCDGKVIEFMTNNISSRRNDINGYFMLKVQKATEKMAALSGLDLDLNPLFADITGA